ncbi:hypothetical protein OKW21_005382 [Catalinimonas alkaloidigena]|nr:hypothetical protein [Catalinimonas alkaloidigena]
MAPGRHGVVVQFFPLFSHYNTLALRAKIASISTL